MSEVNDYKCNNCDGIVKFDPKIQKWKCQSCDSIFELEDLHEKNDEPEMNEVNVGETLDDYDLDEYECPNCGAKIVADKNTTATFCVYCRNTAIIKKRLEGEFKPSQVIPFKTEKEDVVNTFKNFISKKWFAPNEFLNINNIQDVRGVYVPFWLYDCTSDGRIVMNGVIKTCWSDYNYYYTKRDFYQIIREGTMSFDNVPTDASTNFDDAIMDSIEPYEYSEMQPFDSAYLSGFLAEKYDVPKEEAYKRANERITNTTVEELKATTYKFQEITLEHQNVQVSNLVSEYVLFPVWMLNFKYRNKIYSFAMNGQTGKMVGNVPIHFGKVLATFVLGFASSAIIATLGLFIGGVL